MIDVILEVRLLGLSPGFPYWETVNAHLCQVMIRPQSRSANNDETPKLSGEAPVLLRI